MEQLVPTFIGLCRGDSPIGGEEGGRGEGGCTPLGTLLRNICDSERRQRGRLCMLITSGILNIFGSDFLSSSHCSKSSQLDCPSVQI